MAREGRSFALDFFRYVFSFCILVMHFRYYGGFEGEVGQFNGAYLAVEFFFIAAGFLMAGSGKSAGKYIISRLGRILPYYWVSLIALVIGNLLIGKYDFSHVISSLPGALPEIFLLQVFWQPHEIVLYNWYLSAMIWASAAVYFVMKKFPLAFRWIAPVAAALGYGYFAVFHGHVDFIAGFPALLRAAAGLCLGCVVRSVYEKGFNVNAWIMTAIEAAAVGGVMIAMYFTRQSLWDFPVIFLMALLVLALFLRVGYISRGLDRKIFRHVGDACLMVYLTQAMGQNIFNHFCWGRFPFWFAAILLYAGMTVWAFFVTKAIKRLP